MAITPTSWEETAKAKQTARDALIPAEWRIKDTYGTDVLDVPRTCGVLSEREIEITETSGEVLVQKMLAGEYTSYEVTLGFCKRSAIAQQLTNCLTEICYDAALETAKVLDAEYMRTGTPAGDLHGLPVSLKDNFYVKGLDTTVGFVGWANDPATAEQESAMTQTLRGLGAIIYCKTNVPTAMMMAESYNNTWGYTSNPANRNLSSGGSSGGESALLAMKGSPLGVGTDIGGSIRIPAAACGLYSLKPSFGRFTTHGARSGLPGQEAVSSINGPMSSSLEAVELWAKSVVGSKGWEIDPKVVPIPWREVTLPEKLSFGIIHDDGIVKPTPPITRALEQTAKALRAQGHEVIEWKAYQPELSSEILDAFFVGDGGEKIFELLALSGEPLPKGMSLYAAAREKYQNNPPLVADLWKTHLKRTTYIKNALENWMSSKDVTSTGRPFDAIISPANPFAASPKYARQYVTYTANWNLRDQSVCTFPVTRATTLDRDNDYVPRSDLEASIWARYNADESAGAPVSLQMIAQRLEEEKVIELTRVARDALVSLEA